MAEKKLPISNIYILMVIFMWQRNSSFEKEIV